MAAIELRGVDHVGIRYRDLGAAEKFWVEQVGLKVIGRIRAGVFQSLGKKFSGRNAGAPSEAVEPESRSTCARHVRPVLPRLRQR